MLNEVVSICKLLLVNSTTSPGGGGGGGGVGGVGGGGGGGGVNLGILSGGLPPGSPLTLTLSQAKKMSFSTPVFRPGL